MDLNKISEADTSRLIDSVNSDISVKCVVLLNISIEEELLEISEFFKCCKNCYKLNKMLNKSFLLS